MNAIPKSILISNSPSTDTFNPSDRQLEFYGYVELNHIDKRLEGIAKLKMYCRYSYSTNALSLRTIQKFFDLEQPETEEDMDYEDHREEQDYGD